MSYEPNEPRSHAWYLLPLCLGLLGGLIMFFILRKENAQKAKRGLILGIVILPVIIGALFLLALGSDSFYDLESMSCDELQSE